MKTLSNPRDKEEILRRLRAVRVDSPRRWGRMSAHQMVCHLGDACRIGTGETTVSPASGLPQRTIIKWIALYLPLKWPPDIPTRPEIDQVAGAGRCPSDFAADLAEVEALVEAFVARAGAAEWSPHPIFGPLSEAAWMRWGYLHFDHHLRQFGV
jgi:Protein of unknown function (DUF1569)